MRYKYKTGISKQLYRSKITFINRKYPEDNFEDKGFSAYADFDAMQSLDAVEAGLCEEIVEKICDDIFNATVANW